MRSELAAQFAPESAAQARIIYGGSVTPKIASTLLTLEELDGLGMGRSGRQAAAVSELTELIYQSRAVEEKRTAKSALWYWYFYQSGLPTSRAKKLLANWQAEGCTLSEVLESLPEDADKRGLDLSTAKKLQPPADLRPISALCWDDELYPAGLQQLPLKRRPALLFTQGERSLLQRELIYLPPAALPEENVAALREALTLLLDGSLLPMTVRGSEQAALLLAELEQSTGAIALFTRAGMQQLTLTEQERDWLAAGRLLFISPLQPDSDFNPRWESILSQVEAASAPRQLLTGATPQPLTTPSERQTTAWLHTAQSDAELPAELKQLHGAEDLLFWLAETEAKLDPELAVTAESDASSKAGNETDSQPPTTPEETLAILEKGGKIPAVLHERLLKNS